jgi:two-component system cell cycle response regulator
MMTTTPTSQEHPKYTIDVYGFSQTERIILRSIFNLSARRTPTFIEFLPTMGSAPNIFLVDADDARAIADFRQKNTQNTRPAILVGDTNHGIECITLSRPLQWTKVFKAFDLAMGINTPNPTLTPEPKPEFTATYKSPPPEKTQPMAAITSSTRTLAPTTTRPQTSNTAMLKSTQTNHNRTGNLTPASSPTKPLNWVLVCDDNLTVREFMRVKLTPFGFNVDFAETGEQAVGLIGTKHYTCVFLDVVMPGINGYQVCKLIKSKKGIAKTAVIMLSSKDSTFDKIRGTMSGCDAYLTKPVNENRLFEVINKYIQTNT